MRFSGQVVLVTGASRGIGRATALAFAREGATVVGTYVRDQEGAAALVRDTETNGGGAEVCACDVRSSDDVHRIVDGITTRHGRLDVVINNAGMTHDTLLPMMTDEKWEDVMATNVGGVFHVARAAAKPMMLARRGRIINISSVSATKAGRGQANYAASKAAVEGFTRALAVELAPKGILVNAVALGIIVTDMTQRIREDGHDEALSKILLRRFGEAEEVARVVTFLASEDASYITGAVIPVDGGFKMA